MAGKGTAASERPRSMRVDARRNRDRLLVAARELFVEQGVDAPLEDVARRAGVGIATLYRRFPDRDALMRAVALDVLARVAEEARAALAERAGGFRALSRYLHRALDLRIAAVMPVLDGQVDLDRHEELRRARDELAALFEAIVAAARQDGLREDVGQGDIGLMVIRLARPLPGRFPREFDDVAAHRQLDIMLDGLRAGPVPAGTPAGPAAPATAAGGEVGTPGMTLDELRGARAGGKAR